MTGCLTRLLVATFFGQTTGFDLEFNRLEDVWNTAHRNGDPDALASLWADDLEVVVPRMAPMSKNDALAFARTDRMRFERYDTSELKLRRYGETAIVTGRLHRTYTLGTNRRLDDWCFTKVYVRQNGALASHFVSRVRSTVAVDPRRSFTAAGECTASCGHRPALFAAAHCAAAT